MAGRARNAEGARTGRPRPDLASPDRMATRWADRRRRETARIRPARPLELHRHVAPVLQAHRVREADHAAVERHDDRARAEAAAEEADAAHEGAVGDAGRDEED